MTVAATTGFPVSFPYTLILERDTGNEEVVTVTDAAGTTLTVTRGADGTAAVAHSSGATVEHGVSARDYSEPQAHIAQTTGAHGLTGDPVGTTDAQTLTNKTLDGAVLDAASTIGGVSGTALAADRGAWTSYAGAAGVGVSVSSAYYRLVGKTLFLRIEGNFESNTHGQIGALILPAGLSAAGGVGTFLPMLYTSGNGQGAMGSAVPSVGFLNKLDIFAANGDTLVNTNSFTVQGVLEVQ